ncbi:hypothetical protein [Streptomyces sp. NPDC046887]|uniref:hypothetical protein n=1 Tax=Streptomyces sp. NPDC046887 TaxID=3155472 RepID=UPI0033F672C7
MTGPAPRPPHGGPSFPSLLTLITLLLLTTAPPPAGAAGRPPGHSERTAPPPAITLRADTLTVHGLLCPPLPARPAHRRICQARSIVAVRPRLRLSDLGTAVCVQAARAVLTGAIRFRAELFHGRLLGALPLTSSTDAIPPLPLTTLTDAHAQGLSLTAAHCSLEHAAVRAQATCD